MTNVGNQWVLTLDLGVTGEAEACNTAAQKHAHCSFLRGLTEFRARRCASL